jgi:hypothetical protein
MNRKLIYLSFIRLTDKVSRDWYIDYCIEKGAAVEYWDIVTLTREEHDDVFTLSVGYLRYIKTYKEFEELVCQHENQDAVYVMLINYSRRFSKPFRLLSKYNCKMVFLNWGAMPITAPAALRWQRIIYRLFTNPSNFARTVVDVISGIAYRRLNVVKRFDIVFTAGQELASTNQYAKKIVPFNLFDFDHYNRVKLADERTVKGKYAVFLDINLPYQNDLAICGLPAVNATSYFQSLNRFFGLLEKAHGIKIVIVAHPKANYVSNEFEQRESYRMLTAELIKDAEYVITHHSTALSYAILNLKPILFIYTNEMMRIYKGTVIRYIEALASYVNGQFYNVDEITDGAQVVIQRPCLDRYDAYKYSYLTSHESENSLSAEIFLREINAL